MYKHLLRLSLILSGAILLFSCKKEENKDDDTALRQAVVNQYTAIVLANYEDCIATAQVLKEKIDALVANPSEANLEAAKNAWLAARNPYGQSEAFRFYAGPIDDENGPEGLMNAWPIDESYIDYVEGNAASGIINRADIYPEITKDLLESLNEDGSETNISTGWHAIEFLLWGQDLYEDSPGKRPYTDYVTDGSGTASNQARRGTYLKLCAELLISHLEYVKEAWETDGAYRKAFVNTANTNESLGKIISAISILSKGELAGERMTVAVENQNQEDEHSCFSDNTDEDIKMNYKGIRNVYLGQYTRTNGTTLQGKSFHDLVTAINPTTAATIKAALDDADTKVNLIEAPFDRKIFTDVPTITEAIEALRLLGDELAEAANIAKVPLIE